MHDSISDIRICSTHFRDEDIIQGTTHNILKKNANPVINLPVIVSESVEVQTLPSTFDSSVQTDPPNLVSHMVVQAGSSLVTDLRRKSKIQEEYDELLNQIKIRETSDKGFLEVFKDTCTKYLSEPLAEILKAFVQGENKKYTFAYKLFCLSIYYVNPQAYRLISQDFYLPPIKNLLKINLPMSTKINEAVMAAFKIKVSNMTEAQKYCSVAVNLMKLKYNLFYSEKQDKIVGFHEIDGLQTPIPVRYAVVLVARGILVNWTQPIGYALSSATICSENREEISKWIDTVLTTLLDIGLTVKTFVCTTKSKLLGEAGIRAVSVDKPYFTINDKKIYYIYDFPHMFRELRNYFMTHDFQFPAVGDFPEETKRVAKFDDVKEFYERDKIRKLPIATNLTDNHINPPAKEKRDTRLAAELLDKRVAVGMNTFINFKVMHDNAKDTVEFVMMMNDLYEILNSSVLTKSTFRGHKNQVDFLNKVLTIFQSLKLINNKTGQEASSNLTFIKRIQVTTKSILLFFEELQEYNYKRLLTARLNLSVTQNLFKKIRLKGDKSILPSSQRFTIRFRKLYFNYLTKPFKKEEGLPEDLIKAILQLIEMDEPEDKSGTKSSEKKSVAKHDPKVTEGDSGHQDSNKEDEAYPLNAKKLKDIVKTSTGVNIYQFCSMLFKKCLEYHPCELLRNYANSFELTYNQPEDAEMATVGEDVIVTEDFFEYIAIMEDKFRVVFDGQINDNIVEIIHECFKTDPILDTYAPCPCFPVEIFQKMFIKIRLYMTINYNNEMFRKDAQEEYNFTIPELL